MKNPFALILVSLLSFSHPCWGGPAYLSVMPGQTGQLEMHGIRGPATLTVENPDGWIHIEEGGEEGSITATIHQVRGTIREMPVDFHLQNQGPAFPGGPDRLIVSMQVRRAQKLGRVVTLELGPDVAGVRMSTHYQTMGEIVPLGPKKTENQPAGSARIHVRIPNSLMGHVQVRTWNAWVGFSGFETAPETGFSRIVRIESRRRTKTNLNDLHYSSLIRAEGPEHRCSETLLIGDLSKIFDYYLEK